MAVVLIFDVAIILWMLSVVLRLCKENREGAAANEEIYIRGNSSWKLCVLTQFSLHSSHSQ